MRAAAQNVRSRFSGDRQQYPTNFDQKTIAPTCGATGIRISRQGLSNSVKDCAKFVRLCDTMEFVACDSFNPIELNPLQSLTMSPLVSPIVEPITAASQQPSLLPAAQATQISDTANTSVLS
ncbi:MAG: hypothetical protein WBL95_01050 [Microcoleus sp.]